MFDPYFECYEWSSYGQSHSRHSSGTDDWEFRNSIWHRRSGSCCCLGKHGCPLAIWKCFRKVRTLQEVLFKIEKFKPAMFVNQRVHVQSVVESCTNNMFWAFLLFNMIHLWLMLVGSNVCWYLSQVAFSSHSVSLNVKPWGWKSRRSWNATAGQMFWGIWTTSILFGLLASDLVAGNPQLSSSQPGGPLVQLPDLQRDEEIEALHDHISWPWSLPVRFKKPNWLVISNRYILLSTNATIILNPQPSSTRVTSPPPGW